MATLPTTRAHIPPLRSTLIALAWGAMLVPACTPWIWSLWTGTPMPVWLSWLASAGILTLWTLTFAWSVLRPLRGYFLALLALFAGDALRVQIIESAAFTSWAESVAWGTALVIDRALRWISPLLMLLTVLASGLRRGDVFLARGDIRSPVQPNVLLKHPRPWIVEAREFILYFSLGIFIFNWLLLHPDPSRLTVVLVHLPFVLLGAAFNSSSEEVMFRSVLLGRLVTALGPQHALWLQAAFFGLVHWSGNPSGPLGVAMAGFLGWFLGKSVLETRGLAIAVTSHFILNTIQYTIFAMIAA